MPCGRKTLRRFNIGSLLFTLIVGFTMNKDMSCMNSVLLQNPGGLSVSAWPELHTWNNPCSDYCLANTIITASSVRLGPFRWGKI